MIKRNLAVLSLSLVLTSGLNAEVIDRIMGVVNNHIFTLSDVRLAAQVRSVLGYPAIDQKQLLRELMDAQLIEEQMTQFFGIDVTEARVDEVMKDIRDLAGLPPTAVRDEVRHRLRIEEFFDLRFRQFLTATDEEISDYYKNVFVPAAQKRGGPIPSLEQASELIRRSIIQEKANHEVETWLEATRRRSSIEVFE